jgi:hypothetical protein
VIWFHALALVCTRCVRCTRVSVCRWWCVRLAKAKAYIHTHFPGKVLSSRTHPFCQCGPSSFKAQRVEHGWQQHQHQQVSGEEGKVQGMDSQLAPTPPTPTPARDLIVFNHNGSSTHGNE